MLVALVSAKGAPGVTTTALCLTAARSGADHSALMVELDPAGGDLECWTGPHGEAGLVGLASVLGHQDGGHDELASHAIEVVQGVRAITAPTTEAPVTAALTSAGQRLGPLFAGADVDVVADGGRWSPFQPTAWRTEVADIVLLVCQPTLASIEHVRSVAAVLKVPVGIVVVGGSRPYGSAEIAAAVGAPVVGVLPWEPRAVAGLVERGRGRTWVRSCLAAAVGDLWARVDALAGERVDV